MACLPAGTADRGTSVPWYQAAVESGSAGPVLEVRDPAHFDAVADPGVRPALVVESRMRRAPGGGAVRIVELDDEHLVERHVREIPPAVTGTEAKDRRGGQVLDSRPLADGGFGRRQGIDDHERVRHAFFRIEAAPVAYRERPVLRRLRESAPEASTDEAVKARAARHGLCIQGFRPAMGLRRRQND